MMHPDNVALIPFRPPVVLPHVGEKWEGLLRDYAWAMPNGPRLAVLRDRYVFA